jgi:hypothetical protein
MLIPHPKKGKEAFKKDRKDTCGYARAVAKAVARNRIYHNIEGQIIFFMILLQDAFGLMKANTNNGSNRLSPAFMYLWSNNH